MRRAHLTHSLARFRPPRAVESRILPRASEDATRAPSSPSLHAREEGTSVLRANSVPLVEVVPDPGPDPTRSDEIRQPPPLQLIGFASGPCTAVGHREAQQSATSPPDPAGDTPSAGITCGPEDETNSPGPLQQLRAVSSSHVPPTHSSRHLETSKRKRRRSCGSDSDGDFVEHPRPGWGHLGKSDAEPGVQPPDGRWLPQNLPVKVRHTPFHFVVPPPTAVRATGAASTPHGTCTENDLRSGMRTDTPRQVTPSAVTALVAENKRMRAPQVYEIPISPSAATAVISMAGENTGGPPLTPSRGTSDFLDVLASQGGTKIARRNPQDDAEDIGQSDVSLLSDVGESDDSAHEGPAEFVENVRGENSSAQVDPMMVHRVSQQFSQLAVLAKQVAPVETCDQVPPEGKNGHSTPVPKDGMQLRGAAPTLGGELGDPRYSEDLAFTPTIPSSPPPAGQATTRPHRGSEPVEVCDESDARERVLERPSSTSRDAYEQPQPSLRCESGDPAKDAEAPRESHHDAAVTQSSCWPSCSPWISGGLQQRRHMFYDLPVVVERLYAQRGIRKLYDWQNEVLTRDDVRAGRNFVYSLPTSGGKTLVAEISLLRCLLNRRKSGMLVLPFVSLAEEKTVSMGSLAKPLDFAVEGHYGTAGRFPAAPAPALYVCTIEKANSLLNHLVEEGRVGDLGLVVVDELHMVGESRRGATLELFLSKILCVSKAGGGEHHVQIIGMSATVPNLDRIASWLQASCYVGDFRPVPLRQYSVVDGVVLEDGERHVRSLTSSAKEAEQLVELSTEVPEASVLVFCASRQQCVQTALQISRELRHRHGMWGDLPPVPHKAGAPGSGSGLQPAAVIADSISRFDRNEDLLSELRAIGHEESSALCESLPFGVAYHHGGLLMEERDLIERAYRSRRVTILCCTSTLAAGVNLPARRVVFKTPFVGRDFLTKSRYLQMCGRAGRAGLDSFGESFLLLSRRDRVRGHELMRQSIEDCNSTILEDFHAFARATLECVGTGFIRSEEDAARWTSRLLPNYARGVLFNGFPEQPCFAEALRQVVLEGVQMLAGHGLITWRGAVKPPSAPTTTHPTSPEKMANTTGEAATIDITPFGASSVRSCFSVEEAVMVREELALLQQTGLILCDELHLCYFLTPIREVGDCDWERYRDILSQLNDSRQRIAQLVGVDEFFVAQRAMGLGGAQWVPATAHQKRLWFTTRRFFVAMMLCDLLNEVAIPEVEERYHCTRGQLQNLMRSASMFSSSITSFCHAMGWYSLEAVLASYVKRLGFGVRPDIVPLMEIKGIQPARARALWIAGYRDPASLAASHPEELVRRVKERNTKDSKTAKYFSVRSAVVVIREANRVLQVQLREKQGELEALTLYSRQAG